MCDTLIHLMLMLMLYVGVFLDVASLCDCVKNNRPRQLEMVNFDPIQNRKPWTDYNKIWQNWLHLWGVSLNQVLVFVPFFYLYLFSDSHTGQTRGWIFTCDSSKHMKSCKDVSFVSNAKPLFISQNCILNFGQLCAFLSCFIAAQFTVDSILLF